MATLKKIKGKYSNDDAVEKVLRYIFNPDKMPSHISGAIGVNATDPEIMIHQFYKIQKYHRNCKGKRIVHLVLSFSQREVDLLSKRSFTSIGYNMINLLCESHQVVFALHENKKHLHIHIAINPVNTITGKKYRWPYRSNDMFNDYISFLISNEIEKCQRDNSN